MGGNDRLELNDGRSRRCSVYGELIVDAVSLLCLMSLQLTDFQLYLYPSSSHSSLNRMQQHTQHTTHIVTQPATKDRPRTHVHPRMHYLPISLSPGGMSEIQWLASPKAHGPALRYTLAPLPDNNKRNGLRLWLPESLLSGCLSWG